MNCLVINWISSRYKLAVKTSQHWYLCNNLYSSLKSISYIWAASWQNQKMAGAPSDDSDQPGHPPSLIRVFAVRMKKAQVLSYSFSAQRRLWSDWVDAQADLSLRWAHRPHCWFCHEVAHIMFYWCRSWSDSVHKTSVYHYVIFTLATDFSLDDPFKTNWLHTPMKVNWSCDVVVKRCHG